MFLESSWFPCHCCTRQGRGTHLHIAGGLSSFDCVQCRHGLGQTHRVKVDSACGVAVLASQVGLRGRLLLASRFRDWLPPSPNPPHNIHDLGVVPLGVDGVGDLGAGVTEVN